MFARTNLPAAVASASYDAANQLTQWGSTAPTYDANGNMTSDGSRSYTWNARNQLVSVNGGATASFQYDPVGRRVNKNVSGATTGFLYDGLNAVQEQLGGGATANLLTGSIDESFSRSDQVGTHTFLTEALGSTLSLADSAGTLLNQYTYEPFGNTTVSGSIYNPNQFTGRENDATGLYYYRARYYNPTLQRFISEDPIGFRGGLNQHIYVKNNPMNLRDRRHDPEGGGLSKKDSQCCWLNPRDFSAPGSTNCRFTRARVRHETQFHKALFLRAA